MRRLHVLATLATLAALAPSLASLGCTNTAHTEPGDQTVQILDPTALGSGSRIAQLNRPGDGGAVNGQMVAVTGSTFLWEDTYSETPSASSIGSVYVQDFASDSSNTPAYSGILLFKTVFEPASLQLASGDVVDFTGQYQVYTGPSSYMFPAGQSEPEMYEPIVTFRFDYMPPQPTLAPVTDLQNATTTYELGKKWISMLVIVKEVTVSTPTPDGSGRIHVYLTPDTSQEAFAMSNELMPLNVANFPSGTKLKSVTGIVTYFAQFQVAPRTPADVVFADGTTLADLPQDAGATEQ